MVGSAILKSLQRIGYNNIILKTRDELDLTNQSETLRFFKKENPEFVINAAAKVGGILANDTFKAQFIYENIMIQNNLIHSSYLCGVKKLIFLGSSCIYPKNSNQPIKEDYLLGGNLEKTNEPYAIAKIAGIKMCESYFYQYGSNFISLMPSNLYGPNDNFDLKASHVIPGLIRKFHEAKIKNEATVQVWGSGKPMREFLHVEDLANACIFAFENINAKDIFCRKISHINVGYGDEISIKNLSFKIKDVVNYRGDVIFNKKMPDGTMNKLMDSSLVNSFGWKAKINLDTGLASTYQWFLKNFEVGKRYF